MKEGFSLIDKDYNNDIISIVTDKEFKDTVNSCLFFNMLTPWDLRVRKCRDISSYRKRYLNSRVKITEDQEQELIDLVRYIDGDVDGDGDGDVDGDGDGEKGLGLGKSILGSIPWKIVFFNDVVMGENGGPIEGGMCHTMGQFIMFPIEYFTYSRKRKISLLIHEKVHVLQRLRPKWAMDLTKKIGFSIVGKMGDGGWIEDIRRHNPDLDSYDYGLDGSSSRIVELYIDDSSLTDTSTFIIHKDGTTDIVHKATDIGMPSYIGQIEHPYEIVASMIPVLVMRGGGGDGGVGGGGGELNPIEKIVWNSFMLRGI